jgi:hypothetical protein
MSLNPLRSIANLRRAWRLLKIISSAQSAGKGPEADLEAMISRAGREAFAVHEHLRSLRREQTRANGELSAYLDRGRILQEVLGAENEKRALDTAQAADKVSAATLRMETQLKETQQVLQSLRDFSLEQQREIRRLREGYDYTIIKTFVLRMIHALEESLEKIERSKLKGMPQGQIDDLQFIHDLFLFALEGSGIERFVPNVGAKFDYADPQLEPAATEPTDNQSLHLTIARVVKPGFSIQMNEEKKQVIRPAQIVYFKLNNQNSR